MADNAISKQLEKLDKTEQNTEQNKLKETGEKIWPEEKREKIKGELFLSLTANCIFLCVSLSFSVTREDQIALSDPQSSR